MRRSRHILLVITLALPVGLFLAAGEQAQPTPPQSDGSAGEAGDRHDDGEEPLHFTNEDLKPVRLQDQSPESEDTEVDEEAADADEDGDWTLEDEMAGFSAEALKKSIDATRLSIAHLEMHLEYLTSRRLSVQNPILRGLTPSSREEEDAVGGLSNPERLGWVDDQIALNEEELAEQREFMTSLLRR